MDWYSCSFGLLFGAALEAIMIGWMYGKNTYKSIHELHNFAITWDFDTYLTFTGKYASIPCMVLKVRKTAKIRYRYNQVPHLSQDTKWESNKITINIRKTRAKRLALSLPLTTGQHWTEVKAWQTQNINNTNDPQKKYHLGTVSKNILLEGLNRFHCAPTSPLVQVWIRTHRWKTRDLCMHHLLKHINQDIKSDKAKTRTQQYIKLNTRANEIQQTNPSGPDNSQSIRLLTLLLTLCILTDLLQ